MGRLDQKPRKSRCEQDDEDMFYPQTDPSLPFLVRG